MCGHIIDTMLLRQLEEGKYLSYNIWQFFTLTSLGKEIADFMTFQEMIEALKHHIAKPALDLFRSKFLGSADSKMVQGVEIKLAEFLAAEGVLLPTEESETFKVSSPLVASLILLHVIPSVFPSAPLIDVPERSDNSIDTLKVLQEAICCFDKDIICHASKHSFKIAHVPVNGRYSSQVPHESVFDAELCRILVNWLGKARGFQISRQWHLKENDGHGYSNLVILAPSTNQPIIFIDHSNNGST